MTLAAAAKPIVQQRTNGVEAHHPPLGIIFTRTTKGSVQTYSVVNIPAGTRLESRSDFKRLLVRSGTPDRFNYYPVHLLYLSDEERLADAKERGKTVPKKRWIAEQRERINALLAV